jgi:cholest-4-en-3-one 26-monooxygenase
MTSSALTVPEIDLSQVNLLDRDRFQSGVPHEWFAYLRRHAPIAHHAEPDGPGFYVFTRYDDVVAIGRDPAHFSSDAHRGGVTPMEELSREQSEQTRYSDEGQMMLTMDPPAHTRHRRLVNRGFTPKMIGLLESHIREVAAGIVRDGVDKGEVDLVVDMASELPLIVIAELMGIPAEDRGRVFHWSNQLIGNEDPEFTTSREQIRQAFTEMFVYAQELADRARREPKDDIITKLLSSDVDGDRLSEMDFNLFFELLSVAGNETTRNAIAHGVHAFIEHPDQYHRLASDPALIDAAAEEILRWASPVLYFRRNVIQDFDYRGVQLRAGDKVSIWYVSANRDEDVFADPFSFDITRDPNPHVAFGGGGPHHCLGANLARMEIRVFFSEFVKQVGRIEALGPPSYLRSNFIGGIKHLPVSLHPRT